MTVELLIACNKTWISCHLNPHVLMFLIIWHLVYYPRRMQKKNQGSNRNETTIVNHPAHYFRGHGCTGLLKGWQCGVIKAVRGGWGCCFRFRLERTNRYSAENFCSLTTHTEKENINRGSERERDGERADLHSRLFTALPVAVFHLFPLKVT